MKFTLVLLVVAAVLGCALSCSVADFDAYKIKYDKVYADAAVNEKHMQTYCATVEKINAHNLLYKQGKVTYSMGINQFTDLTPEEMKNSGFLGFLGR